MLCLLLAHSASAQTAPSANSAYEPLTARERFQWFATSTAGPNSLATGVFNAAYGTALDSPHEYGTHWEGFGKRYGMRLTGVSTSNAIEAGLGAAWGEDPRYFRRPELPFKSRVQNVVKMTFLAQDRSGRTMPAYARYIAIPASNFLSNTWRTRSEADARDAVTRSVIGVLGKMAGNAFTEFFPDVWNAVRRRHNSHP